MNNVIKKGNAIKGKNETIDISLLTAISIKEDRSDIFEEMMEPNIIPTEQTIKK